MQSIFNETPQPRKKKLMSKPLEHSSSLTIDDDLGLDLDVAINFKETTAVKKHIKIIEVKKPKKKHNNEPDRRQLF